MDQPWVGRPRQCQARFKLRSKLDQQLQSTHLAFLKIRISLLLAERAHRRDDAGGQPFILVCKKYCS